MPRVGPVVLAHHDVGAGQVLGDPGRLARALQPDHHDELLHRHGPIVNGSGPAGASREEVLSATRGAPVVPAENILDSRLNAFLGPEGNKRGPLESAYVALAPCHP